MKPVYANFEIHFTNGQIKTLKTVSGYDKVRNLTTEELEFFGNCNKLWGTDINTGKNFIINMESTQFDYMDIWLSTDE